MFTFVSPEDAAGLHRLLVYSLFRRSTKTFFGSGIIAQCDRIINHKHNEWLRLFSCAYTGKHASVSAVVERRLVLC